MFTGRAMWVAWQDRSGQARADAIFALVDKRTPMRPTDTPGATAWLQFELDRYGRRIATPERAARFRAFATSGDVVPQDLGPVLSALREGLSAEPVAGSLEMVRQGSTSGAGRRDEFVITHRGRRLVLTQRREALAAERDPFVSSAVAVLARASEQMAESLRTHQLPATPDDRPPHLVRIYAISDDGTLVSAPWVADQRGNPDAEELALLAGRSLLPSFAPQEFFFRFAPDTPASASWYSGFYLDLGGRGLVSTVMVPFSTQGRSGVLAFDLAFDIDWSSFAGSVEAPVVGAAVHVPAVGAAWTTFDTALVDAPVPLRTAVETLARRTQGGSDVATPVRQGVADGSGAVVAFQVSAGTWLLMLFPQATPSFPIVPLGLMAGLLTLLLVGFEVNRRRADAERRHAEGAFAEKQNLLDTMQVPLVVVDPNTDVIVTSNRSAETIGLSAGSRFADFVSPDVRARAHYERMQVATPEPRRAYGVPVRVPGEAGAMVVRHAVVRSVAVTAPIAALAADERHRLGIVFLLEQDADVPILAEDIATAAHREERRRLAGLLSHGVDTLARVLEHQLTHAGGQADAAPFVIWLSEYLERRLTVTGWLLDHWDADALDAAEVVIEASQAQATIDRVVDVFALARRDRDLRARLHWSNGVLSAPGSGAPSTAVVDVHIDWPASVVIGCPVRGGFGVFVGELLVNAIRHGAPGSVPRLDVVFDRVRRELQFRLTNTTGTAAAVHEIQAYGGLDIVRVMARLFGWGLTFDAHGDTFVVSWTAPASDRGAHGQPD